MLQARVYLIRKLLAVDRIATSAGAGRIAGLEHKVGDDAVEDYVVVIATLSQGGEVLAGLRNR